MTADPITDNVELPSSLSATVPTRQPLKFAELFSAGRELAVLLNDYSGSAEMVVVAIARGGVPVALEVANRLGAPLDLILIRRMLAPLGAGSEICALNVCGTLVLDQGVVFPTSVPESPVEYFVSDALEDLALRARTCRGERPALEVAGKKVLLIDNGIHTGSTVLAAIRGLRILKPSRLVVGIPVAAPSSRAAVEEAADELICLAWPEPFGHVGLWYSNFSVPSEEQIRTMLDQASPHP